MSTTLTVRTLGDVAIELNGKRLSGFASRKAEALFIYLACSSNATPIPRDVLATLLWSDNTSSRALANLSVMLSSLRKQLGDYIETTRHTVAFVPQENSFIDAVAFQQAVDNAALQERKVGKLTRSVAAQFASGLAHYQGDFLLGFSVRRAPEFESWVLLEQERLRQSALSVMETLITYHAQRSQLKEAIGYAQRLVQADPLNEVAQRQLISLFAQDGQQAAALAQVEACRAVLADELGVEPDEETEALAAAVRNGSFVSSTKLKVVEVESAPTNVPHDVTRFFGRISELTTIDQWLSDPYARLITIIGIGGVGKSRLAREVANRAGGDFQHGVYYISLAAINDLGNLIAAIANAIELPFSGSAEPREQLLAHLRDKEMLLVLDNFEQLIVPACLGFVSELVGSSAELQLLVTSREPLNLQAELLLDLQGLPYAQPSSSGFDTPAAQLFVERVQRLKRNAQLEPRQVHHLCQLFDGLPLALELAAGLIRNLPLSDIVAESTQRIDVLTTALYDVPDRHRSVRAVFEWSWQLLSDVERALYTNLAVFRGGFTLAAAETVANGTPALLAALIDKSLLWQDDDGRYFRHPLLAQFSAEKLAQDAQNEQTLRQTHAHYFSDRLQQLTPTLKNETASKTIDEMGVDLDNILTAWQWLLTNRHADQVRRMVIPIGAFYHERSRFREGQQLFETALASTDKSQQPLLFVALHIQLTDFQYHLGRFQEARQTVESVLPLARSQADKALLADALQSLADILHDQGYHDEAIAALHELLALCREQGDESRIIRVLNGLGNCSVSKGAYDQAWQFFEEGLALAQKLKYKTRIPILLSNMGIVASRQDEQEKALDLYQQAQTLFAELGHQWGHAATTHNIGMVYGDLGRTEEAIATMKHSLELHRAIDHRRGEAGGLSYLGTLYRELHQYDLARDYLLRGLQLQQTIDVRWAMISTIADCALLESAEGHIAHAVQLLTFACNHPACEAVTREEGQQFLDEFREELGETRFDSLVADSADWTLEQVAEQLLSNHS